MKRLFLNLLLICLSASSYSQIRIDWQQCYGSMETDNAYGIVQCGDRYFVVGTVGEQSGMVGCSLGAAGYCWLIEIDDKGDFIGEECIIRFGPSYQGLLPAENDSFFLVGLGSENQWHHAQIEVRKYESDGSLTWTTQAGNPFRSFLNYCRVAASPDGGVVVANMSQWACGPGEEFYGMDDSWVVKINSEGEQEWEIMLGTEGLELPAGVFCDSSNNTLVFIAGLTQGNGNIANCYRAYYDGIVTKLNENGEMLWSKCYGGSYDDAFGRAVELENGYLFVGEAASDDGDLEGAGYHLGYHHGNQWEDRTCDVWLMKTDFDGNIIWSKCYGGTGNDHPAKVFQNDDGGFTVFGTSKSIDGDVQSMANLIVPGYGIDNKLWIFRTDSEGNLLWERALGPQGTYMAQMSDVIKLDDKTYTIAATSHVVGEHQYAGDWNCSNENLCSGKSFWVLHITDIFNYDDPTGIEEQPKVVPLQMKVHPNPATTWVAIDYTLPTDNAKAELSVFNAMGVKVKQVELDGNQGQKVLDLRGLAPGVYFYTLCCGGLRQTDKLVLVR